MSRPRQKKNCIKKYTKKKYSKTIFFSFTPYVAYYRVFSLHFIEWDSNLPSLLKNYFEKYKKIKIQIREQLIFFQIPGSEK